MGIELHLIEQPQAVLEQMIDVRSPGSDRFQPASHSYSEDAITTVFLRVNKLD